MNLKSQPFRELKQESFQVLLLQRRFIKLKVLARSASFDLNAFILGDKLRLYSKRGDLESLQILVADRKTMHEAINSKDVFGFTALHYALENEHLDVCNWLRDRGAKLEVLSFSYAVKEKDLQYAQYLIDSDVTPTESSIEWKVKDDSWTEVRDYLLKHEVELVE